MRRQAPDGLRRRNLKVSSPITFPLKNGQRCLSLKAVCYLPIVAYFEESPIARPPKCALPYPAFQLLFVLNGFIMICYVLRVFVHILDRAHSLIRQGRWLFVSLSNFVILLNQLQNSRDVCLLLTTVSVRDIKDTVI
jgi:hypothetical protein